MGGTGNQVFNGNVKDLCYFYQLLQARFFGAAFDAAHVCGRRMDLKCQAFLGKTVLYPVITDPLTDLNVINHFILLVR